MNLCNNTRPNFDLNSTTFSKEFNEEQFISFVHKAEVF